MVNVQCPHCGAAYEIPVEQLGYRFQCSQCQKEFEALEMEAVSEPAAPPPPQRPQAPAAAKAAPAPHSQVSNLIECPTCKKQVSPNAATCPHCGEVLRKNKCRSFKGGFVSLGVGLALAALVAPLAHSLELDPRVSMLCLIGGIVGACICWTSPAK